MTDLVDRPAAEAAPEPGPGHWVVAAALVGAAAIHLAMTPSHLGESAVEGTGFLVAAWAQALLAVVVVWRPTRRVLLAVGGLSVALIAAWIVSRTAGLPFGDHAGHAESVSVVDGLCVALEGVAAVAALALAFGFAIRLMRSAVFGAVGTVAALTLSTGAVASPSARDHAAGSHGAHGAHEAAADQGHAHGAATEDDKGFAALSNGHQHEAPVEPLTTEERVTLARQLTATAELVETYPTLGAAKAAGWRRAGPFVPGLGTHYNPPNRFSVNSDGDMDPEDLASPILVFDGLDDDAPLAGFMYMSYGRDTAPEGFAGPNDMWHYHEHLCVVTTPDGFDTPFGADLDGVTEEMCTDAGGAWIANTGYMVHVWNVPGYESPDGLFHEVNRRITCPDGTYYKIPTESIGGKDSVCRNP